MLLTLIGESCVGKTTLANALKEAYGAQIFSGKDYLRLAKNEGEAKKLFQEKLKAAVDGETILYLIAEKEQLSLLPEGAVRILVTADLALIQELFAARMGGKLPAPVAAMLEKKHGCFDKEPFDLHIHNGCPDAAEVCRRLTSGM